MRSWYHTLEFPDGTVTPGFFDTRTSPAFVPWPKGLAGGRCLDVGTFDGFWAFEMERRGAGEVVALDLDDPDALDWPYDHRRTGPEEVRKWKSQRGPGFLEAAAAMGSKAQRINQSVYDLNPDVNGQFDVVFCGALLLHLRDPVRAIEAMRSVCRGELVLAETIEPSLEFRAAKVPAARLVLNIDQWWRVNTSGLEAMVFRAGFEVAEVGQRYLVPYGKSPAAASRRGPRLSSILARKLRSNGVLHRALRAVPRPPADAGR